MASEQPLQLRLKPSHWQLVAMISVLVLLAIGYYIWTWSPILAHRGGDNAYYLLTAQYYSPYSDPTPAAGYFAKHNQYPPVYPMVLALFGGGETILAAHLITTTFLLLALVVFLFWLRLEGVSYWLALMLVLVFALLPGTYMQALAVLSEYLYLLLSLLAIVCVTYAEKVKNEQWLWGAMVFVASASMTRSAGITLIAAFCIYLFVNKHDRKWWMSVAAIMPYVLWQFLKENKSGGYIDSIAKTYASSPLQTLLGQVTQESQALWNGWMGNFNLVVDLEIAVSLIGVFCIAGFAYRLYLKKFDAIYLLAYIVLILIWPFPAEARRFIFVVLPLFLFYGVNMIAQLRCMKGGGGYVRMFSLLYCFAIGIVLTPDLLFSINRFTDPLALRIGYYRHQLDWYVPDKNNAARNVMFNSYLFDDMRNLGRVVSDDECVYSIKPSVVGLLSGRVSKGYPPDTLEQDGFMKALEKNKCSYFYMANFNSPSYPQQFYPLQRMQEQLKIVREQHLRVGDSNVIVAILGRLKQN